MASFLAADLLGSLSTLGEAYPTGKIKGRDLRQKWADQDLEHKLKVLQLLKEEKILAGGDFIIQGNMIMKVSPGQMPIPVYKLPQTHYTAQGVIQDPGGPIQGAMPGSVRGPLGEGVTQLPGGATVTRIPKLMTPEELEQEKGRERTKAGIQKEYRPKTHEQIVQELMDKRSNNTPLKPDEEAYLNKALHVAQTPQQYVFEKMRKAAEAGQTPKLTGYEQQIWDTFIHGKLTPEREALTKWVQKGWEVLKPQEQALVKTALTRGVTGEAVSVSTGPLGVTTSKRYSKEDAEIYNLAHQEAMQKMGGYKEAPGFEPTAVDKLAGKIWGEPHELVGTSTRSKEEHARQLISGQTGVRRDAYEQAFKTLFPSATINPQTIPTRPGVAAPSRRPWEMPSQPPPPTRIPAPSAPKAPQSVYVPQSQAPQGKKDFHLSPEDQKTMDRYYQDALSVMRIPGGSYESASKYYRKMQARGDDSLKTSAWIKAMVTQYGKAPLFFEEK